MATLSWTFDLDDGDVVAFDPTQDILAFDDAGISAAAVTVTASGQNVLLAYAGKTVRLQSPVGDLTNSNVTFSSGTWLMMGDNSPVAGDDDNPNSLTGTQGDDQLIGLGGEDTLSGGLGNDRILGGNGDDLVNYTVGDGIDAINGGNGADTLRIFGTFGDDVISVVTAGGTALSGLGGATGNVFNVEMGDLRVDQAGADTLDYTGTSADLTVILDVSATGFAVLIGSTLANVTGGSGNDSLTGDAGANVLKGAGGNDTLNGAAGGDTLDGGLGSDIAGYATASAGVTAWLSNPAKNAGEAAGDSYASIENLSGSPYRDLLVGDGNPNRIDGLGGNDSLEGFGGGDTLIGNEGNDYLYGAAAADTFDGGNGSDYARYDLSAGAVIVYLANDYAGMGEALGDTFSGIEGIVGSPFDDAIYGDVFANTLQGRDGNDTISSGIGKDNLQGGNGNDYLEGGIDADTLYGNAGSDTLHGDAGNDSLYGGAGADTLDGGTGADYARYDGEGAVTVYLDNALPNAGAASGDTLISIERLVGSSLNDALYGDANANNLQGRDGNDIIEGRAGDDSLKGGKGIDMLDGGPNHDSIYGEAGADVLHGGAGADYLYGGTGGDVLDGGADVDFVRYDTAGAAVTVDLLTPLAVNTGDAAGDTYIDIESVVGSPFADRVFGDDNVNELQGRAGLDRLDGRGGNDILDGGTAADILTGGPGNDTFCFVRGQAMGEQIVDFAGNGAASGDRLQFSGYGAGAAFTFVDATHWRVISGDGLTQEVITFTNAAPVDPTDYSFI